MEVTTATSLEELKAVFEQINKKMEELEAKEPAEENSKEYEKWCEECEALAVESETVMSLIDEKMRKML